MRDFTLEIYKKLLNELIVSGYEFMSFSNFIQIPHNNRNTIILRHDVDKKPDNSLKMARLENQMGIAGTYYFRVGVRAFNKNIIKEIARMGHEIGYHYEDLNVSKGDIETALQSFERNLESLRDIVPITTICMHGSPLSKYDNRWMWKKRNYKVYGLKGEPYFDINFNEVMYLSDTGRRWDGREYSIRDRVMNRQTSVSNNISRKQSTKYQRRIEKTISESINDPLTAHLHSTWDIMKALKEKRLSRKIMLTIHPQRWNDNYIKWMSEYIWQNIKNQIKKNLVKKRENVDDTLF